MRKVISHPDFLTEKSNNDYLLNKKDLTKQEIETLLEFEENIHFEMPHCGKTKKNNGSNTTYHSHVIGKNGWNPITPSQCFSKDKTCKIHSTCCSFFDNTEGKTSESVIYFAKNDDDDILILFYGRQHIPFPDTYELLNRMSNLPKSEY